MRDLLDAAWQSYGTSRYIAPAVAALVLLLSVPHAPLWSLLVFAGWTIFAYASRLFSHRAWMRDGAHWSDRETRNRLFLIHIVTSMVWGMTPILLFEANETTRLLIGLIVCTVAVVGTFDSAAVPRIQVTNIIIELSPIMAFTLFIGTPTYYLISTLLALFSAYLIFITYRHFGRIQENLLLQSERTELVEKLRHALAQAEASSIAKTRFLANMSHELRTPLNGILGFAQMIRLMPPSQMSSAKNDEYAGLIEHSGEHLLGLINDLLDIAKAEAGKMELAPEWVSLDTLAQECAQLVGPLAVQKPVDIQIGSDLKQVELFADRQRLKQAILNLLSNGIKFTGPRGNVSLDWADPADGGAPALVVADSGIGMSRSEINHAIRPFEQVQRDNIWKPQGTGLGLPIVSLIAEAHGGSLKIDSAPGEGTSAHLVFPAERARPIEAKSPVADAVSLPLAQAVS